jgi:hypothetical protein
MIFISSKYQKYTPYLLMRSSPRPLQITVPLISLLYPDDDVLVVVEGVGFGKEGGVMVVVV